MSGAEGKYCGLMLCTQTTSRSQQLSPPCLASVAATSTTIQQSENVKVKCNNESEKEHAVSSVQVVVVDMHKFKQL